MRKLLLLTVSAGLTLAATAQTAKVLAPMKSTLTNRVVKPTNDVYRSGHKMPVQTKATNAESTSVVDGILLFKSLNVFTVLTSYQTCMFYQPELNLIAGTFRQGSWGPGGTSGLYRLAYSTNNGATWDTSFNINDNGANRYPSGVIYNPTGNTTLTNAYAIGAGTSLSDETGANTGAFVSTFYGSRKMDGTNLSEEWQLYTAMPWATTTPNSKVVFGARHNMSIDNQGRYRIMGYTVDSTESFYTGAWVATGVWNAANNNWTVSNINIPGTNMSYFGGTLNMAWSDDGQTGYIAVMGIDTTLAPADQKPTMHIWKSTDAGATYSKLPAFDFSTVTALNDSLTQMTTGGTRPMFFDAFGMDAMVDYQGRLHLFYGIGSAYSDHPDSLGYSYTFPSGRYLYDIYQTASGWNAKYIHSFATDEVADAGTSPIGQAYTARIQAGKSTDSKKIFVSFTDSDPSIVATGTNDLPNLFVAGFDVSTGAITTYNNGGVISYAKNVTLNTNIDASIYYHFMADRIGSSGSDFNIHCSYTKPDNADPANGTCDHYYISGVKIAQSEFVSTRTVTAPQFEVSQNYPNPSNGETAIAVTLKKSSNVQVAVMNTMGQQVWNKNFNNQVEGRNILNINANLSAGVYFYTVTVDGQTVTNKMMVK